MLITNLSQKNLRPVLPYSIKKALVALEFGETDHSILDYLQFLTTEIATRSMSFIHIFPDSGWHIGIPENDPMASEHKVIFLDRLRNFIEDMVNRKFPRKRSFEIDILEGNPLEQLLEKAQKTNPDLIIIGQKKGQQFHAILAKNLARQLKGSALIIPENATHRLKNILVPIDFSTSSGIALRMAIGINKSLVTPTQIHVLHIATLPDIDRFQINRASKELKTILKNNIEIAFEVFLKEYAKNDIENIQFHIQFQTEPQTPQMIQNYAQQHDIDLIAMGAKGFTNSQYISLGSVTERVLDFNLPIPTFILK